MLKLAPVLSCLLLIGCHTISDSDDRHRPVEVTAQVASDYAAYAMLASNCYHKANRIKFPVELLDWVRVDLAGNPTDSPTATRTSGLAYDIFEKRNSEEVAFAFRGTDSKRDFLTGNFAIGPTRKQYTEALEAFRQYRQKHPQKKITLTGHSLGGALALTISVREGIDAVAFDASPRISDGLENRQEPAKRVMIYQAGEILVLVRMIWQAKFTRIVPPENTFRANFNFPTANKHRADLLADGLLRLGATINPDLARVRAAPPL
ncbi:MAG: hypothetical protein HZC55_13595 [Verrucomicrobia bacterium]|nr:hypothetical protein [Verrucomicrobiota bacterium]